MHIVVLLLAGQLMSYNNGEYVWRHVSDRGCMIKAANTKPCGIHWE